MTEMVKKDTSKKNKVLLQLLLLAVIFLMSSAPIFRGCMTNTGESLLWCLRLARVLPVGMVEPACLVVLFILRLCLVMAAYLFFYVLAKSQDGDLVDILAGVILFSFSPYQLYISYDKVDLTDIILWILILIFASFTLLIIKYSKEKKVAKVILLIIVNVCIIGAMAVSYLVSYIGESLLSFEGKGYVFGEMFTSFFYQDDHPGLGIALFVAVCLWIYYVVINIRVSDKEDEKNTSIQKGQDRLSIVFAVLALISMILASVNFPWDSIIRDVPLLGKVILRLEAPTIFFGISSFCLCIPAVRGISYARKSENEFVSKILPIMILFFAVAIGMFLVSQYMYWQYPLEFVNI